MEPLKEILFSEINKKLVVAFLLIIGGTIFVIIRRIRSNLEKSTYLRAIAKCKRLGWYTSELADTLDVTYGSRASFSAADFQKLKQYLAGKNKLGPYDIDYTNEVNANEILIFSSVFFVDFDVGITGTGTDVKKRSYVIFLLVHDRDSNTLFVKSDTYESAQGKFEREGFLNAVFHSS